MVQGSMGDNTLKVGGK